MRTPVSVYKGLDGAIIAAVIATIFALTAYGRWPYGYYENFRWIISVGCLYAGYNLRERPFTLVSCLAVALTFNPIEPMRMRAYQWQHYDIAAACVMAIVSAYALYLRAKIAADGS